jgi:electron transport complex protein RnfB
MRYPGCVIRAAIATGDADINQCPPGGEEGIAKLADLLGAEAKTAEQAHGVIKPESVAVIDESSVSVTTGIQACPVDAILGAAKQMHTIIASECTGCELCVAPCPVDCISMTVVNENIGNWKWKHPVYKISAAQP